ncbi:MAG: YbaB/EbfC family nucleoid-associated protein [Alphaproteobacteria bacterium]
MKLGNIMKQAQEMQAKMAEMQENLSTYEVNGESGAGLVKTVVTGKGELIAISISPEAMDPADPTLLEDLIIAAVGDAKSKADAHMQEKMSEMTGGLGLPAGFKLPF